MITEDYCSFEIAKLLKEKGFDGECIGCYWDSKKTFDVNYEPLSYSDGDLRDEVIIAPTYQMAMKWLREKGLFIEIHIGKLGDSFLYFITIQNEYGVWGADSKVIGSPAKVDFPTYEEAVEAALKYCLTELI